MHTLEAWRSLSRHRATQRLKVTTTSRNRTGSSVYYKYSNSNIRYCTAGHKNLTVCNVHATHNRQHRVPPLWATFMPSIFPRTCSGPNHDAIIQFKKYSVINVSITRHCQFMAEPINNTIPCPIAWWDI